jgi:hypothetical protein
MAPVFDMGYPHRAAGGVREDSKTSRRDGAPTFSSAARMGSVRPILGFFFGRITTSGASSPPDRDAGHGAG